MNRGRGTTRGRAGAAGATPTPSTRGGRGASAPATARFRPKNVRRNEAERDSIAQQEAKKDSDRAAAERRASRGKFRSKRSRGDAMGRGGRGGASSGGKLLSGLGGSGGGFAGGFGGGGGGGGFGMGSGMAGGGGGGGGGRSSRVKGERSFNEARDTNREARINADRLHVMEPEEELDSDDEAMMAELSNRSSIMPMGIYRRAHKEAEVVVATTAELEAAEKAGEEESLWVDDGSRETSEPIPEQPPEEGVWDTAKPFVKKEANEMDLDVPDKPEKPKVEIKIKKAPPKDHEDRVIDADLELLRGELGSVSIEEDGETKSQGPANKDGRMYLFQFPPLLPPLKAGDKPKPKVKADPESEEFSMADAPPAQGDTPVDLTEEAEAKKQEEQDDQRGFDSSLLTEGGMVGKMVVRKSGKVELDWGGRILDMSPATGMNFLTTAVILEENDEKPQPGVNGGESIGMGKIMGRFVLAPVWGEEEEWEVDPKELEV